MHLYSYIAIYNYNSLALAGYKWFLSHVCIQETNMNNPRMHGYKIYDNQLVTIPQY